MNQTVDVFIAAALLVVVRVAEINSHPGLLGDFCMSRHFSTMVVGHAFAHRQRHAIERGTEALRAE